MKTDTSTVDRIVAGVLTQLATGGDGVVSREASPSATGERGTVTTANVITADVLSEQVDGDMRVIIGQRAIVTPAARDAANERGIEIVRLAAGHTGVPMPSAAKPEQDPWASTSLIIVVRKTDAVERLCDDVKSDWRWELLGCPDEAAEMAVSAVCRGEAAAVVILVEQTHRAACLANRNDRVKAVAIGEANDIRSIRNQLKVNVWCLDPTGRSWFELRNILSTITKDN